jgi:hypothetical protein
VENFAQLDSPYSALLHWTFKTWSETSAIRRVTEKDGSSPWIAGCPCWAELILEKGTPVCFDL